METLTVDRARAERAARARYAAWIAEGVRAMTVRAEEVRGGVGEQCSECRGRIPAGMEVVWIAAAPLARWLVCAPCAAEIAAEE